MKRLITYTAIILGTLAGLYLLWGFRQLIVLFGLSLFIAAMIRPAVDYLSRWGVSRGLGQLLLYVVASGLLLIVLLLAGDILLIELNGVVNQVIIVHARLFYQWQDGAPWQQLLTGILPPPLFSDVPNEAEISEIMPSIMAATRSFASIVGGSVLLLVLSLYWSTDQYRFERLWLSLLPATGRSRARQIWRSIEFAVGSYLRSQFLQSVLAALFLGLAALVLGLKYPLSLALLGALAAFIPLIGGVAAATVAFIFAGVQRFELGVAMAIYTLILFLILELAFKARFSPRERRSFLLMILVVIVMFELMGVVGLIISPPLTIALEVVIRELYTAALNQREEAVDVLQLKTRFEALSQRLTSQEEPTPTPELRDLTARLGSLLHKVQ